jgi:hypothetical protein
LTAETDPGWTYWKVDEEPDGIIQFRFVRQTGRTERWTGTEWLHVEPGISRPVNNGDLFYTEITPEEAAMILGVP